MTTKTPVPSTGAGTAAKYPRPHTRRGITVGAFGGFIASIGIMLWLPIIFSTPVGIFLHALGLSVIKPIQSDNGVIVSGDIIRIGLAGFGLIVAQGIIVGIIFGIVTAKIKRLSITNKKKGIGLGLATGVIAYLVLFVSVILSAYSYLLTNSLTTYPHTIPASLQGLHNTQAITAQSQPASSFIPTILGYGLFAYLIYGFILGGILAWANSVSKAAELEKYR